MLNVLGVCGPDSVLVSGCLLVLVKTLEQHYRVRVHYSSCCKLSCVCAGVSVLLGVLCASGWKVSARLMVQTVALVPEQQLLCMMHMSWWCCCTINR